MARTTSNNGSARPKKGAAASKSRSAGRTAKTGKRNSGQRRSGHQTGPRHLRNGRGKMAAGMQQGPLLENFFIDQLKDIYYAEHKITEALPKMKAAATTEELKDAFEDHLLQTSRHIRRLERVFQSLGKQAEGKKCEAIEGIAREADEIIRSTQEGTLTRDAALIIAAQKVEHYEIATYGGLLQLAITMDLDEAADLLDRTLIEEEATDMLLTDIAENEINLGAECEGNIYSWEIRVNEAGEEETSSPSSQTEQATMKLTEDV